MDEQAFQRIVAGCARCGGASFEVASYLDRQVSVMLADANDDGRWMHDGEQFIASTYRVRCTGCGDEPFASSECPRCRRAGVLAAVLAAPARLVVPKRCPSCSSTELLVSGVAPAVARTGAGKIVPAALAGYGEPGFHIAAILCDGCDWMQVAEGCVLCG